MRVAIVAGEYPTSRAPERAMFVRDQVDALRAYGHEVRVIHHEPPTLRRLVNRMVGLRTAVVGRRAAPSSAAQAGPSTPAHDIAMHTPTSSHGGQGSSVDIVPGPVAPGESPRETAGGALEAAGRSAVSSRLRAQLRTTGRLAHDRAGQWVAEARMRSDLRRLDPAPDVIHAHNTFPAGIAAVRFGDETELPVVITEHSSAFLRGQLTDSEIALTRRVLGAAAQVVAVSPRQATALPIDATDVLVVPNVLPAEFTLRPPGQADTGDIVTIGTLMPHKGMDTVIRCYAMLPRAMRDAHRLVVIGGGPQARELRALADELGVGDRVTLTGPLSRAVVAGHLRHAAVLMSASPVETFGMTLIEGLACGVPFVAVRSGGPESIWFPGAGELVDRSDPWRLVSGLARILDSPADAAADEHRRAVAQDRFGARRVADTLTDVYERARASAADHKGR